MNKFEKPRTREELLRDWILLQHFVIEKKRVPIAEGCIIAVLNTEVVMVDIWRNGNEEKTTTHYFPLDQMTWDEFTETGFIFDPPKQNEK